MTEEVGLEANGSDRIGQLFETWGIRGWEPLRQGFRSQELPDVVKCGDKYVCPEFIRSSVFAVHKGSNAAMLRFSEVGSLSNYRGETFKRTEQLLGS